MLLDAKLSHEIYGRPSDQLRAKARYRSHDIRAGYSLLGLLGPQLQSGK